jgi:hypothetical protein
MLNKMSNIMMHIRKFSNTFIVDTKNDFFVGRWTVPNNNNQYNHNINLIIDRNNEDHCGVCSVFDVDNKSMLINDNKLKEQEENYYLAFIM